MDIRVRLYVATVVLAALAVGSALAWHAPMVDIRLFWASAVFAVLGLAAQAVAHSAKKDTTGSIAFLPFLTGLVLYPAWTTVPLVAAAMLFGEFRKPKPGIKRAFNVAQYSVSVGVAVAVYNWFGGVSVLLDEAFRFIPHVAAVVTFLLLNTLLVSTAIGLSTRTNPIDVWLEHGRSALLYDIAAIPIVYWCALFYSRMGWVGVASGFVGLAGLQQLYMKNRLLGIAYEETLELLVGAVELRDKYTSGHSQRVRKYSQIIASCLRLPKGEIERIGVAALLHDVGKIDSIFEPILQKPGRLTDEERATMELHPIKSAELVSRASQLSDIVATVRHHHENWDGTGYPDQLAGTNIPLGSRIIMFADTIDAMTSDRPYRKALTEVEVRSELSKFRGTQFDPNICDILVTSPEFSRIFDKEDSGRVQSLTQIFDRVKRRARTPVVV